LTTVVIFIFLLFYTILCIIKVLVYRTRMDHCRNHEHAHEHEHEHEHYDNYDNYDTTTTSTITIPIIVTA